MMNDYSYRNDAARVNDSRWVHRPLADWEWIEKRNQSGSIPANMFQGLQQLIRIRKENIAFSDGELEVFDSGNEHILSFVRYSGAERVLVLANFSEKHQVLQSNLLRLYGFSYRFKTG